MPVLHGPHQGVKITKPVLHVSHPLGRFGQAFLRHCRLPAQPLDSCNDVREVLVLQQTAVASLPDEAIDVGGRLRRRRRQPVGEPLDGGAHVRCLTDPGVPLGFKVLHAAAPVRLQGARKLRAGVALRPQSPGNEAFKLRPVGALPQHLLGEGPHLRPQVVEGRVHGPEGLLRGLLAPRVQLLVDANALLALLLQERAELPELAGARAALHVQRLQVVRGQGDLPAGRAVQRQLHGPRELLALPLELQEALAGADIGQRRLQVLPQEHGLALLLLPQTLKVSHDLRLEVLHLRALLLLLAAQELGLAAELGELLLQLLLLVLDHGLQAEELGPHAPGVLVQPPLQLEGQGVQLLVLLLLRQLQAPGLQVLALVLLRQLQAPGLQVLVLAPRRGEGAEGRARLAPRRLGHERLRRRGRQRGRADR
mmetsp:Transcript_38953/g.123836  ORF Transcript_38953/g.123836 Transcript_38953/m.123836 type:complete len:424 (+) Transcript_38953:1001-2272(+)